MVQQCGEGCEGIQLSIQHRIPVRQQLTTNDNWTAQENKIGSQASGKSTSEGPSLPHKNAHFSGGQSR
jgi:hypothetical protein